MSLRFSSSSNIISPKIYYFHFSFHNLEKWKDNNYRIFYLYLHTINRNEFIFDQSFLHFQQSVQNGFLVNIPLLILGSMVLYFILLMVPNQILLSKESSLIYVSLSVIMDYSSSLVVLTVRKFFSQNVWSRSSSKILSPNYLY